MSPEFERAIELRKQGQYESAREILLQLIRTSPDDPFILLECAFVHDSMGLENEAVPYYEKAIRLGLPEPWLAEAYLGLGSTYRCLDGTHWRKDAKNSPKIGPLKPFWR